MHQQNQHENQTMNFADRLASVRQQMNARGLDALIIPRADEYLGEYIPERNERLRWISGFTGSAGVVVVLADRAAIFVDGRYTVQVRKQVSEELFEILHLLETPHVAWLAEQLNEGSKVGFDPRLHPFTWYQESENTLSDAGMEFIVVDENLVDACWEDRPEESIETAIMMPESLTGGSSTEKRKTISEAVSKEGADAALIFAADSLAWLLNDLIRAPSPCRNSRLTLVLSFNSFT